MNNFKHMLDFMIQLNQVCHFQSREGKCVGNVSNSELRRWFERKAVQVNGSTDIKWNDPVPAIETLVLFPKGDSITLS